MTRWWTPNVMNFWVKFWAILRSMLLPPWTRRFFKGLIVYKTSAVYGNSSEEESESESGLFLANETQFAQGTIGRGSRQGLQNIASSVNLLFSAKPKHSLLRRQKAEIKAQMKDLQAKIYQNQLMSLAGFSLGSYPIFNGPPQERMISLNLDILCCWSCPYHSLQDAPRATGESQSRGVHAVSDASAADSFISAKYDPLKKTDI